MDLENTGNDWMEEAPLLSATDKKNPFTVPENYFSNLENDIRSRCVIEDSRFSNEEEFPVPADYFESLIQQTESRIAEEVIRGYAPSSGFTVPEGYFTTLQQNILAGTTVPAKPAEALIRPIRTNWIRYAAAACVTVVLGSVLIFNNQKDTFEAGISHIPDQEIINYLQIHSDIGDTPMILESLGQNVNLTDLSGDISDAELEEYISTSL
ncbi:hypothetical protein GZH53_05535 [Flavihumibacter sp. R14]|nr:hypothetical protein [Flavihumibacter soli]